MPDSTSSHLGELLFGYRSAAGLSQEDLAHLATVSVRAICDLERGVTRRPQRATVAALTRALALAPADAHALEVAARRSSPSAHRPEQPRAGFPVPAGSLVGREAEVADLLRLLSRPGVRLVTITGPGGAGKTRLALEVARRLVRRFERVAHADLATPTSAAHVAVAAALGVPAGRSSNVAAVIDAVGDRRQLLVLDDADRVTAAGPELGALLAACRGLTVLATGRAALHLLGEHPRQLGPLPLPPAAETDPRALRASPAVALLVERAAAVRTGFDLDARNAGDLNALVQHLGGMPLALELAAAQLRTSEPHRLLAQLRACPRTEPTGPPGRSRAEDRTVRAAVEWSARRLTAGARDVLAVLGTFSGPADPQVLATVLADAFGPERGADLARDVEAHLAALAAAALLTTASDPCGRVRVHLLGSVRSVAAGMLDDRGPAAARAVRGAHARALLGLLRGRGEGPGPDDLRAALDRTLADAPGTLAPEHVVALLRHLAAAGRIGEARGRLAAVAAAPGVTEAVRAAARYAGAVAAHQQCDHAEALACAQRAAAGYEQLADPASSAAALAVAGSAHRDLGRPGPARQAWEAALERARRARDEPRTTALWNDLARLALDVGEHDRAADLHRRCLAARRRAGDERGVAASQVALAAVALETGDWQEALSHLRPALDVWRRVGEPWRVAVTLARLSQAQLALGDVVVARRSAGEGAALARDSGHRAAQALADARLGDLAVHDGDPGEAVRRYTLAIERGPAPVERIRVAERLAVALALAGTVEGSRRARRTLDEAARARRDGGYRAGAGQQEWAARARDLLAGRAARPVSAAAGPASAPDAAGSGPARSAARSPAAAR